MSSCARAADCAVGVVPDEAGADSGVHRLHLSTREPELARTTEQPLAVERHDRGGTIGAREEVRAEALRLVMPDLGSVQRQHHGLPLPNSEQDGQLGKQPVAVHVHDVRSFERRHERAPDPESARRQVHSQRCGQSAGHTPGHPRHGTRQVRLTRRPRRVRDVRDAVARVQRPRPELPGEQRICRLVRRQMRGHVQNVHQAQLQLPATSFQLPASS